MKKNILTVTKKAVFAAVLAAAVSTAVPAVPAHAAAKLNKKSVTLQVRQTVTLKLKGNTKKVKWTSTKPAVASVTQKGKVTAKKAGKANIKAKAGKKTYTCRVTVKAAAVKNDTAKADESLNTADNSTSAGENTGAAVSTGSAAGTSEAQAPVTVQPAHEHDYVPHYSYDGTGKAVMNAYFCTDTTCADNQGYGTDNGWRGEKYTPWYDSRDNAVSAQPSQGTTATTPVNNDTTDVPVNNDTADSSSQTGNTVDTGSSTGDTQTGQTEEQPAAHAHSWTIPVMSADGITLTGYRCAGCSEESHVHLWTKEITQSHPTLGTIIIGRRCRDCSETITSEDFETLSANENAMQAQVMNAWIAKNITSGMTDLEKVRKAMAEMNSYTHSAGLSNEEADALSCLMRTATCLGGNGMFADYCRAMGINAEVFSAGQYVGGDHYLTYVYVNGEKLIADATPGGGITGPGTLWTEDALWLYCDLLDGNITDEEYEAQIGQLER